VQTVVVFGPEDDAKRSMLRNSGHTRGLEWFTKPFSALIYAARERARALVIRGVRAARVSRLCPRVGTRDTDREAGCKSTRKRY
jgi:hypothetical protein